MISMRKHIVILAVSGGLMLPLAGRADDNTRTSNQQNNGVNGNEGGSRSSPANQGTVGNNASSANRSELSAADQKFITAAANGGMAEVKMGQLAAQRAQSNDVKQFGQKMVDDHSKANDELKALAQKKGVQVPMELKGDEKQHYDKLDKTTGADFDREYVRLMVEDHQKDIQEFKKEAQDGKDADVKAWAAQTLPTLEQHYKHIEQVAQSTGVRGARTAGERQSPDSADSTRSTGSASPQQPGPGNQDKKDNTGGNSTAQPIPRDNNK